MGIKNRVLKLLLITTLVSTISFSAVNNETHAFEEEILIIGHPPPWVDLANLEDLLISVAFAKFGELDTRTPILKEVRELYIPIAVGGDFKSQSITIWPFFGNIDSIESFYEDIAGGRGAEIVWHGEIWAASTIRNLLEHIHGSGGIVERREIEYNDILYQIAKRIVRNVSHTSEYWYWVVAWGQHGQAFTASLCPNFTKEEVLAFCNVKLLNSWELNGNAASVSIQNMENVRIFDAKGNELTTSNAGFHFWQLRDGKASMIHRLNYDGTREVVGYRFLIDEALQRHGRLDVVNEDIRRYQYVLKPGIYMFHVEGVTGERDLLVKHFDDHEVISRTSYAEILEEQSTNQFIINVDSFAVAQTLRMGEDLRLLHLAIGSPTITEMISGRTLTMDVMPIIQEGRTLVPVRFIAEKLGADVEWNQETQTATILLDGQELSLTIGETVPGMDIPAQLIDGRTMAPLRFVAEYFGAVVTWSQATNSIGIIR